jgi:hypothetical protein
MLDRETAPDLSGIVLFAHACRAMRWLKGQATRVNPRLAIGYETDLYSPPNGNPQFWEIYEELHSFVPERIAASVDVATVRREFYELCTDRFRKFRDQGSLIELVALIQSRDQIVFA